MTVADDKLFKRYEVIQRQCEDQERGLGKLKSELEHFIQSEEERRRTNWRVDFGEEAKVDTESTISSMLFLSNGQLAIAATNESGDS